MNKIGEIKPYGVAKMTVYYDKKAKQNPYKVYTEWSGYTLKGYREQKRMVEKYADLYSCVAVMAQYAMEHNEEGRGINE